MSAIEDFFVQDPTRLVGEVLKLMRVVGRMSPLMAKGEAPEGMGANYQTLLWERSANGEEAVWTDVQPNTLTTDPNTCNPDPLIFDVGNTIYNYGLEQSLVKSREICMQDVRIAYNSKDQVMGVRDDFKQGIVDAWEERDKMKYFALPGHKIVANAALTDYYGASDFGTAIPTSRLTAGILRNIYEQLIRDAGGEEPVAISKGAAAFVLLISPEASEGVLQADPSVRQDIQYAQMGEGEDGWLMRSWNVDRVYAGFLFTNDVKMPRWDFNYGTGAWIRRPFYVRVAATNGTKLIPNPAYRTAAFEDTYVFVKQAVRRDMPKPFGSGGSQMTFDPVNFNGEILWKNIPNETTNPLSLTGRYYAPMMAAYKPLKPEYSYIIRSLRCDDLYLSSCY